ncbi:adenosylcobinamide-phosphate synthase CbiB [Spirulina sp. 06S082]|uniref:adenosylcobinamide-phosphate synthase CbiB n=1 Tax=Spirulina sp. 06S082 TaxID=3110248 RepID=UPI002B21D911|nr:adenosylcobinamide-phosphate synthase CbiB [Spirulina sp. 06S082]MEA5470955.1 adenosylcobinamide-phosphate synthase CbiB [Spirulina sp. 06S082]
MNGQITNEAIAVLILASLLDRLIGDPWSFPHPVKVMGAIIHQTTQFIFQFNLNPGLKRSLGILLGGGLILGSAIAGWAMVYSANLVHPFFGMAIASLLLGSCFAGRSLRDAAMDVLVPLKAGKIDLARAKLSQYVGRETANLSEEEILRAILETVAENTTDGVTAPLFYAILGLFFPLGSVPLCLAYKAVSTLDSMIGYLREPYTDIGWFSAKLEDILTWLPCRITILTIALVSGKPKRVLFLCRRDAPQDPSPNSGWSECAYAAALGVQLGGENIYQGIVKDKPFLGESDRAIAPEVVLAALHLMRTCFLLGLGLAIALYNLGLVLSTHS